MTFWLITLAITLVICFIGFYPLLKSKQQLNGTQRSTLNKHFYFQRLKEVEQEANEGMIEDAEQTKQELQQSLLDDIPEEAEQQASIQAGLLQFSLRLERLARRLMSQSARGRRQIWSI